MDAPERRKGSYRGSGCLGDAREGREEGKRVADLVIEGSFVASELKEAKACRPNEAFTSAAKYGLTQKLFLKVASQKWYGRRI